MKLQTNPAEIYISSLPSKGSHRSARDGLNLIARVYSDGEYDLTTMNWGSLRYKDTVALRSYFIEKYQPKTVNKLLSILRGVLKVTWRLGLMSAEDYQHAIDLKSVTSSNTVPGRMLTDDDIKALFKSCAGDRPADIRDRALLSVLLNTGLRREEVTSLDIADYEPGNSSLTVRHGKRHRNRQAYLPESTVQYLNEWLHTAEQQVRLVDDLPLFLPVAKGGKIGLHRMTPQALYKNVTKRADQAGVKDISPHDFRRTFISTLLDRGADLSIVSHMAGHAEVDDTATYDRRGEAHWRKTASLVDFKDDSE